MVNRRENKMAIMMKKPKMNDFLVSTVRRTFKPSITNAVYFGTLVRTYSRIGWHYTNAMSRSDGLIYVYHAEKVRPKSQKTVELYKSGAKKGTIKKVNITKVREGGWTMRVFAFPKDMVKRVEQFERHFKIELKFNK